MLVGSSSTSSASRAIRAGILAAASTLLWIAPAARAADHTTYVVTVPGADRATLERIEALGGVIDHFDGRAIRAYVHVSHWDAFRATGIPYEIQEIQPGAVKQLDGYPTYAEIGALLADAADAHPEIVRLVSLGRSIQGRELWALQITDQPDLEEDEPEFAYISTMHGDEKVGTVLCLNFLDVLLDGYGQDATVTAWVDGTVIWLVPLMNPDGYEMGIRWNANNRDLNRSFPVYATDFSGTIFSDGVPGTAGREPEVAHIMNWTAENSFVLTANYHTGALLVNYPYDYEPGVSSGQDAPTPDDALMRAISLVYAHLNPPMYASTSFPNGITNGSAWYSVADGMQDWLYRFAGQIDLTLEVSNIKSPPAGNLQSLWDDNREAMSAYLALVHRGVRGVVTDRATGAPLYASVRTGDNPQPVFTDPGAGDFHRLLLPGSYPLRVEAPGYIPFNTAPVAVAEGPAVRADIALSDGDVNLDGAVDAVDLQLVINTVLGLNELDASDLDGGGVTATDVQHLVNRVLGR